MGRFSRFRRKPVLQASKEWRELTVWLGALMTPEEVRQQAKGFHRVATNLPKKELQQHWSAFLDTLLSKGSWDGKFEPVPLGELTYELRLRNTTSVTGDKPQLLREMLAFCIEQSALIQLLYKSENSRAGEMEPQAHAHVVQPISLRESYLLSAKRAGFRSYSLARVKSLTILPYPNSLGVQQEQAIRVRWTEEGDFEFLTGVSDGGGDYSWTLVG